MRQLAVLLAAATALAAPEKELVREEAFNYRVVGKLPPGWKRRGDRKMVYAFSIEGIPHAYVYFVRERLRGDVDVEQQILRRAPHYRFPGAPDDAKETTRKTEWAGRPAWRWSIAGQADRPVATAVPGIRTQNGSWVWMERMVMAWGAWIWVGCAPDLSGARPSVFSGLWGS